MTLDVARQAAEARVLAMGRIVNEKLVAASGRPYSEGRITARHWP